MTDVYADIYSDLYSGTPVALLSSWPGAYAAPLTFTGPPLPPGTQPLAVEVENTAGNWMFAFVTWRTPPGQEVTMACVADDAHNWWEPFGAPTGTSSSAISTRTAIWFAPTARAASVVQCSPAGFMLSMAMVVVEFTGLPQWVEQTLHNTGITGAGTSLSMSVPAPPSSALMLTCAGTDLLPGSPPAAITGPGAGWSSAGGPVFASNGSDHTSDLQLNTGWQILDAPSASDWSSAGITMDFAAVAAGVVISPVQPPQPSPYWPIIITEAAVGSGQYSTADTQPWQNLAAPSLSFAFTQGRQYELGQLAAGSGQLTLDNPAGLLMPPSYAGSAGIDSGTPVRIRAFWPGGAWQAQFNGNGSTALPEISTGPVFVVHPGTFYSASGWLACSPAWPAGVELMIIFYNAAVTQVGVVASAPVTGSAATAATASGVAPAGSAIAAVVVQAQGTPPIGTVFTACAGFPLA